MSSRFAWHLYAQDGKVCVVLFSALAQGASPGLHPLADTTSWMDEAAATFQPRG